MHPLPMPESKAALFNIINDTVSIVAIGSPWWLPVLKGSSELAGLLLPILGVVWLSLQISFKIIGRK